MANNLELITQYLPKVYDEVLVQDGVSWVLRNGRKDIIINWTNIREAKVATMTTSGFGDYHRAGTDPVNSYNPAGNAEDNGAGYRQGFSRGGFSRIFENLRLKYQRSIEIPFDAADVDETGGEDVISLTIATFLRTRAVVEQDAMVFSDLAACTSTSLHNRVEETIGDNEILGKINKAVQYLRLIGADTTQLVCFMNPDVYTKMINSTELVRYLAVANITDITNVQTEFKSYNGIPLIPVNKDRFFTDAVTSPTDGFYPTADSKIINFMLVPLNYVDIAFKFDVGRIYSSDMQYLGFNGYKFTDYVYYGTIIPKEKQIAIYASVSEESAATATNLLLVDLKAGVSAGVTAVTRYYTAPGGIRGILVYSESAAFVAGTTYTIDGTDIKAVPGYAGTGVPEIPTAAVIEATGDTAYFALLDASGTCVATTGAEAVTLPKGE